MMEFQAEENKSLEGEKEENGVGGVKKDQNIWEIDVTMTKS